MATACSKTGLRIAAGQYSSKGRKPVNQDFHGLYLPTNHQLLTKGIALAVADGISTSTVSQEASAAAITGFLSDYYSTPDTWSTRQSAGRVIRATNAWLHAQTRQSRFRYDLDRGYVCTFSALILKSATAHLFHVGDSRIYRLAGDRAEQLTTDHQLSLATEEGYLTRALGLDHDVDIDYFRLPVMAGDVFMLSTDGVHEYLRDRDLVDVVRDHGNNLDDAARALVDLALARGSKDNLTVQLARIESLPLARQREELQPQWRDLPFVPELRPGQELDGFRIVRQLHASSRSHVYLTEDDASGVEVVLKCPSLEQRSNPDYLEQFQGEEWIARRIDSPHVVRPFTLDRVRSCCYLPMVYVPGQSLRQWMLDNPRPELETVRALVEQIAIALRAFHRLEMVHRDLKPDNILVDPHGTVTLIDFGATRVAGLQELWAEPEADWPRGAALYSAPECFLGDPGTWRSDLFSLGVIAYQLMTGQLPYGAEIPKLRTLSRQRRLRYRPITGFRPDIPAWVDRTIARAVSIAPHRRHGSLSEWLFDLRHPASDWLAGRSVPLIERHPLAFWQGVSLALLAALITVLIAD
ncbi:bifunctional protein-serine/threonine kinase/phosphatase [Marinobacter szutsaonensis]